MEPSERASFIVQSLVITIWLAAFGTQIEFAPLKRQLKKPRGVIIGVVLQVLFLPAWTTALLFIFGVKGALGMGFLVVGSSPGGTASNIWCLLANSDLALSAAMTCLSTFVCAGSMVANLTLWGSLVHDQSESVPFVQIIVPAFCVIIGTGFGMYLRVKYQFTEKTLTRIRRGASIVGVIIIAIAVTLIYRSETPDWDLNGNVWAIAILMNGTTLIIGAGTAWGFGLLKPEAVSVGFEVSTQNLGIPLFIFANAYEGKERSNLITVLFLFGIWSFIQNLIFLFAVKKLGWTYDTIKRDDDKREQANSNTELIGGSTEPTPTNA